MKLIFTHHYGRPLADVGVLREYAAATHEIRADGAPLRDGRDVLNSPMLEAQFEHFSITIPGPETPKTPLASEVATA